MSKLETINKLAMEIVNDEDEWYQASAINAQRIGLLSQPIMLNENQQIVLDWLQAYADSDAGDKPIFSIGYMMHLIRANVLEKRVRSAYFELTVKQQNEVLQAFAEWGLSHERN